MIDRRQTIHYENNNQPLICVSVLPNPEVSHVTSSSGVSEANCTARSRPPAEITWDIPGENRTLGPPVSSAYDQGDGTTVVTSTVLLQSAIKDLSVTCVVQHPGLEKPIRVSLPTDGETLIFKTCNSRGTTYKYEPEDDLESNKDSPGEHPHYR